MGASLSHLLRSCVGKYNPDTSHVRCFQRPGARFGPAGIRAGSQRIRPQSWNPFLDVVASDGQELVDCGDVPMSCAPLSLLNLKKKNPPLATDDSPLLDGRFTDNAAALDTLTQAYSTLIRREMKNPPTEGKSLAKDGKFHPRIVTLGGGPSTFLPSLSTIPRSVGVLVALVLKIIRSFFRFCVGSARSTDQ